MHITIEHFDGKYPSFNISLQTAEGVEPFVIIKGCRIISGANGDFISYPATKNATTGKYWNHVYGSEGFNESVMKKAKLVAPKPVPKPAPRGGSGFDDMDDDIPY